MRATTLNPRCEPARNAQQEGQVLLVRKPKGRTSFDVVKRVRRIVRGNKVGHAGTLDPMATGLLIVCTGKRTKSISEFMGLDKEYRVHMILGARTPSFDSETPVTERSSTESITEEQVMAVLRGFVGRQMQFPPMWSAAKVGGTRLYKLARKGQTVERKPREIIVHDIRITEISIPDVHFTIVCSKGTYVRSLVDDAGRQLGCGAYVAALERTRIGEFRLENAVTLEDLATMSLPAPPRES